MVQYGKIKEAKVSLYPLEYGRIYGRKLRTQYKVKPYNSNKWHRVYCMNYGNSGSIYYLQNKKEYFLHDYQINEVINRED